MKYEFVEYLQQHKEERLAVTTILQTHGSTPRKAGTTMIVQAAYLAPLGADEQKMKFASAQWMRCKNKNDSVASM